MIDLVIVSKVGAVRDESGGWIPALRPEELRAGVEQNLQTLGLAPWLLFAAVPVIVVILAFNFLGDGLRDAADPYG